MTAGWREHEEEMGGDGQEGRSSARVEAVLALSRGGAGAAAALPRLLELLTDEDAHVRKAAALALGELGAQARRALPHLIHALADEVAGVRHRAAVAVQDILREAPEALGQLDAALENADPLAARLLLRLRRRLHEDRRAA